MPSARPKTTGLRCFSDETVPRAVREDLIDIWRIIRGLSKIPPNDDKSYLMENGEWVESGLPEAHARTHESGGSDEIKLDDLGAPDDNTDLDATDSAHGLMPKLSGVAEEYLGGDGTWHEAGGGGHEILDPDGDALTQRDALQFTGDCTVTDDSGNERTVVNIPTTNSAVLYDTTLTADAQNIDISGISTKACMIIVNGKNGESSSTAVWSLYFNGDTTASNYHRQAWWSANGTTVSAGEGSDATVASIVAGRAGGVRATVTCGPTRLLCLADRLEDEGTDNITTGSAGIYYEGSNPSAVTSIRIASDQAKGFATGTRVIVLSLEGGAGYDITTTETAVPAKRYAGSQVYTKRVDCSSLPNATSKTVAHGITGLSTMLSVTGSFASGSTKIVANSPRVEIYTDASNLNIVTTTDLSAYSGYAVLEYTKA